MYGLRPDNADQVELTLRTILGEGLVIGSLQMKAQLRVLNILNTGAR